MVDTCTTSKPEPLDLINRIKLNRNELTTNKANERRDSSNSVTSIHSSSSSSNAVTIISSNIPPSCSVKNNKRMKKSTQKKSDKLENDTSSAKSNQKSGFVIENDIAIDPNTNQTANESSSNNPPKPVSTVQPTTSRSNYLPRADLFDYNPITNFIGYNKNIEEIKSVDEKILNENDQVKDLFEKNSCKKCTIKIIDCFRTGVLNNQSAPVILTDKIKNALIINPSESSANNTTKNSRKNSKSSSTEVKQTKRNLRGTRRIFSTTTESDNASIKSTNESDSESLASNDTNILTSRAKRKRSVFSSESSHSIETISSTHSTNNQNVEKSKDTETSHNETLVNTNESRDESFLASNHSNTSGTACSGVKSKITKKINEYFLSNEKLNSSDSSHSKDTSMEVQTPSVAITTPTKTKNDTLETSKEACSSTSVTPTTTTSKEQPLNHTGGKENAMVDLNTSETDPPAKKFKSKIINLKITDINLIKISEFDLIMSLNTS